ncbi:MAG: hypothetical protein AAF202_10820, partial [Pseudomonadota bacterium]
MMGSWGQSFKVFLFASLLMGWPCFGFAQDHVLKDVSVPSLAQLIKYNPKTKKPVASTEEFLSLLPISLRSNFTFVFDSRSPFKDSITEDYPRVVLFTPDTKTIVTFTGQPDKPGANIIEMIGFNDKTSQ